MKYNKIYAEADMLINDNSHISGKIFALVIQILIIISLIAFSISTLPNLSLGVKKLLYLIEIITIIIFTLEYILRVVTAKKTLKYIFSFYGLIDLIAILPFYMATSLDLRAIRIFRLLRLIRILKLFKYNQAINRFRQAMILAKEELIIFCFISVIILYLSAVGIYYFEHAAQPEQFKSVFHSLWWAITTLTTVGYGDMFPITTGGKTFTFFILMIGLGIIAVPTGLIASALSQTRKDSDNNKS